MNPITKLNTAKDSFNQKELAISQKILNNLDFVARESATNVSKQFHISQASLTRFCKKIGYNGYNDFRFDLFRYLKEAPIIDPKQKKQLDYYIDILNVMKETLNDNVLNDLAEYLYQFKKIYITGFHKSHFPAQLLNLNLKEFFYNCQYISYEEIVRYESYSDPSDLLIVFSSIGPTYYNIVKTLKEGKNAPQVLLFTQSKTHSLIPLSDKYQLIPTWRNLSPEFLEDQIFTMIFVDLLTTHLIKQQRGSHQ